MISIIIFQTPCREHKRLSAQTHTCKAFGWSFEIKFMTLHLVQLTETEHETNPNEPEQLTTSEPGADLI